VKSQKRASGCKRAAGTGAALSKECTQSRGFCSPSGCNHSRWVAVCSTGLGKVMIEGLLQRPFI